MKIHLSISLYLCGKQQTHPPKRLTFQAVFVGVLPSNLRERLNGIQEVVGSIPIVSTIKIRIIITIMRILLLPGNQEPIGSIPTIPPRLRHDLSIIIIHFC